jgi:hypothetical protein
VWLVGFRDHFVSLPALCQAKKTLFRWKNTSIRLMNIAFVKSQIQHYFMDQFQVMKSLFFCFLVIIFLEN